MTKQVLQIENIEGVALLDRLDRLEGAINRLTTPAETNEKEYLTRKDVARKLEITLQTLNDWTRKGLLTAYKIGRRVYYKQSEVNNALVKKGGRI